MSYDTPPLIVPRSPWPRDSTPGYPLGIPWTNDGGISATPTIGSMGVAYLERDEIGMTGELLPVPTSDLVSYLLFPFYFSFMTFLVSNNRIIIITIIIIIIIIYNYNI